MDWSKAKTILILALLVTNLVLGFFWLEDKSKKDPTLEEDFIEDVRRSLEERGIRVGAEIPKEEASLPPLIVEYQEFNYEELNRAFFKGQAKMEFKGKNQIISLGQERLEIANYKKLSYYNKSQQIKYQQLDAELAERLALEFLKRLGLDLKDMTEAKIYRKDGYYRLSYFKKYGGVYLEKAYMHIDIDQVGVRSLERLWLELVDEGDNEIYINTAPKSLLSLLGREDLYGKTIDEIDLCYYFDPKEHDYLKTPQEAKKGKTIPAWRVSFTDGSRTVIDNY